MPARGVERVRGSFTVGRGDGLAEIRLVHDAPFGSSGSNAYVGLASSPRG
jgi:hypothetical protein